MILSMSSSRAVSMRIGTSEVFRMRRHNSTPSPSGRLRSRMTSAGESPASWMSAACADAAVLTASRVPQIRRDERRDRSLVLDDEDRVGWSPRRPRPGLTGAGSSAKRSGSIGSGVHSAGRRCSRLRRASTRPAHLPVNLARRRASPPRPTAETVMPIRARPSGTRRRASGNEEPWP